MKDGWDNEKTCLDQIYLEPTDMQNWQRSEAKK